MFSSGKLQVIEKIGERGGTRTHDPMIKSHVLYQLSYALSPFADDGQSLDVCA